MKNILRTLIPTALMMALLSGSALGQVKSTPAQPGKIGTVDLRKLFDGYWKTKRADADLKERAADYEKDFRSLRDNLVKAKEDYQKLRADSNDQAVSAEERERRAKAADDKLRQIKESEDAATQFQREAGARLEEQKRRMRDNILTDIRSAVNSKAQAGGYSMVIDTSAETVNATPVVVYNVPGDNDLTSGVLSQLNIGAPLETAKPVETKPVVKPAVK